MQHHCLHLVTGAVEAWTVSPQGGPTCLQQCFCPQTPVNAYLSHHTNSVCWCWLLWLLFLQQGVLDLSGSSPRRYLFQVLSHFTSHALHKERLEYFATAEGRDDLYR